MTRLRDGVPDRPREERQLPAVVEPKKGPRRGEEYHTLLDAIDAALARRDDSDDVRVALLQTYATVWAAVGYGLWVVVELMIRLIVALARLVTRRGRRAEREAELEDQQWTTTMKRKGRVR